MTESNNIILKDILENTDHPGLTDGNKRDRILSGEPFEICSGDVIQITFKDIDPTLPSMALGAAMSEAGRNFANVRCEKDCPTIFVNGNKSHADLALIKKRFNAGSNGGLKFLCEDMMPNGQELNYLNSVLQERTIEYLESAKDVQAVIFDDSNSLLKEPFEKDAFAKLRNFSVRLRQLNILQVWALTHEKGKLKFPTELATKVWQFSPGKELTFPTLELQILKDIHRPAEALQSMTLEIQETEDGLTLANASAERNDRLTAMLLLSRGKNQSEVAEILRVHQSTISIWLKRYKEKGLMSQSGHDYTLTEAGKRYLGGQAS